MMNLSSDLWNGNASYSYLDQDNSGECDYLQSSNHQLHAGDGSSFLLRLDGHVYDVSNLAPSSKTVDSLKKKKVSVTKNMARRKGESFSLYPRDAKMVESIKSDLILWDPCAKHDTTSSRGSPTIPRTINVERRQPGSPDSMSRITMESRGNHNQRQPSRPDSSQHSHDHRRYTSERRSLPHMLQRQAQHHQQYQQQLNQQNQPQHQQHNYEQQGQADAPYLSMTLDTVTGCPLMELGGPGNSQKVPYFGANMTSRAIHAGNAQRTVCMGCNSVLTCMRSVAYIICPGCHVVSPLQDNNFDSDHLQSTRKKLCGVGIGLRQPPSPSLAPPPSA